MPATLPFRPSGAASNLIQPNATHRSYFTGFAQRVLSGYSVWRGELIFAPINTEEEAVAWRAFYAAVETGDKTFWAPLATAGSDDRDEGDYAGVIAGDRDLALEAAAPEPIPGDIVQIWITAEPEISECAPVEGVSGSGNRVARLGRSLILMRERGIPLSYRFVSPLCRAFPVEDDYGSISARSSGFSEIGQITWGEAIGQNTRDLYGIA